MKHICESIYANYICRLGNKATEQAALQILQEWNDLITPQDATTEHLVVVQPMYSIVFTFEDSAGDLRLTVTWKLMQDADSKDEAFEGVSKKWARLERAAEDANPKTGIEQYDPNAGMSSLLDVALTDLNTGMAWQFDVNAAQAVDKSRLSESYVEFEHSIKVNNEAVRKRSAEKLFVFYRPSGVRVKSIQQNVSYRYYLSQTDYNLELTRFQNRVFPPRTAETMSFSSTAPTVFEPRWSLSVYRTEWDQTLSENEHLPIGQKANWADDVDTWFPEDAGSEDAQRNGLGFAQLMTKLKKVAKLMREANEGDNLVGGMKVG